jgi:hypothetical protein
MNKENILKGISEHRLISDFVDTNLRRLAPYQLLEIIQAYDYAVDIHEVNGEDIKKLVVKRLDRMLHD